MLNISANNYIDVFGFHIYYYALCIMGGIIACALLAIPLFKRRGVSADIIMDCLIAIVPLSIIFARTWYVVCDLDEFFRDGEMLFSTYENGWTIPKFLDIRGGGMAIHGGVLGGAIGLLIVSLIKKIPLGRLCDVGAALLPLGQAVGRWGNFFNQEVFGNVVTEPSLQFFPYAVYIERLGEWHVALFFFEMVANLIVFALLYTFLMRYKGRRNWYVAALYFIFYGTIRAIMEPMRDQEFNMGSEFLGLPMMSWFSIIVIIGGVALFTTLLIFDIKEKNYWWKELFEKKVRPENAAAKGEAEAAQPELDNDEE